MRHLVRVAIASIPAVALMAAAAPRAMAAEQPIRYCGFATASVVSDQVPNGESLGDVRVNTYNLVNKRGATVGTAEIIATLVSLAPDQRSAGRLALNLPDGKVFGLGEASFGSGFLDPKSPPVRKDYSTAIVGGTGAYAGIRGTITRSWPKPGVQCWTVNAIS